MDPLDRLADERRDRKRLDLGQPLGRRQRDRVGQDDLLDARLADVVDRGVGQYPVAGTRVDLVDALALKRRDDLDQRTRRVDLVVDDHRPSAADLADHVHQLGAVEVALAPLLNDREWRA